MKLWIHMMCGYAQRFPDGVDPNRTGAPCNGCKLAIGGWAPA